MVSSVRLTLLEGERGICLTELLREREMRSAPGDRSRGPHRTDSAQGGGQGCTCSLRPVSRCPHGCTQSRNLCSLAPASPPPDGWRAPYLVCGSVPWASWLSPSWVVLCLGVSGRCDRIPGSASGLAPLCESPHLPFSQRWLLLPLKMLVC